MFEVLEALAAAGYVVLILWLNASDLTAPMVRERIWFLGIRSDQIPEHIADTQVVLYMQKLAERLIPGHQSMDIGEVLLPSWHAVRIKLQASVGGLLECPVCPSGATYV